MKFLHEEFFGKVYDYIKSINVFFIRVVAKLLFWLIIFSILGLFVWLYYAGKINWIFWIVGLLLAAEITHYLRKLMERKISMKTEESSNIEDQLKESDPIKKEKKKVVKKEETINKGGLLKKKK
jgi:ABC-type bacteriocin/lantibiotic exporter with double-glycine peptidase domain